MNFFEQQAAARRGSGRLVLLFALAVAGIVLVVDLVTLVFTGSWGATGLVTLATLAVIGLARSTRDHDASRFDRLAQHFEYAPVELGQLIEKEDSVMGQ